MGIKGTVRDGALIAGALAVGVTGAAAADKLLTGKDIEDGSLAKKELSKKAQKALKGQTGAQGLTGVTGPPGDPAPGGSLLSSRFGGAFTTPIFVEPGTDFGSSDPDATALLSPPVPAAGFTVRGLAARSVDTKFSGPLGGATVTFLLNGTDTELTCVTSSAPADLGTCTDSGSVAVTPGQLMNLRVNGDSKNPLNGTIALSLQPAG